MGDVIAANLLDSGVDLVASMDVGLGIGFRTPAQSHRRFERNP
ncbi:MAG: hypothetical protein ACLTSX_06560 [Collinsella sp.]